MTSLENHRTHYCPDSGFSLISENDLEFEQCNCYRSGAVPEANSRLAAEQTWYRTLAALARVCGIGKTVKPEPVVPVTGMQQPAELANESELVRVRKAS